MDSKSAAVLLGQALIHKVFNETRTWTCRHCGGKTTIQDEVCSKCGIEDCEQGE